MSLRPLIMKVISRNTSKSVNGPLTQVLLTPAAPLETNEGTLTFFLFDAEDLAAYQVGKRFKFTPEAL